MAALEFDRPSIDNLMLYVYIYFISNFCTVMLVGPLQNKYLII
jgi:hypothetical protein